MHEWWAISTSAAVDSVERVLTALELRTDVRAVNQLSVESWQLRGALSRSGTTVRAFPMQVQPNGSL
ncbi:hypothetical protein [Streptomyces sp. NBC_01435]|uniref:hypothetical protein n=1 Tax=Streptomyces sp. NBC_01435 TaxID=2903865 RepID=UPI002E3710A9|nr:hypothetical protein [Streptomyces sp. NBC_01435]